MRAAALAFAPEASASRSIFDQSLPSSALLNVTRVNAQQYQTPVSEKLTLLAGAICFHALIFALLFYFPVSRQILQPPQAEPVEIVLITESVTQPTPPAIAPPEPPQAETPPPPKPVIQPKTRPKPIPKPVQTAPDSASEPVEIDHTPAVVETTIPAAVTEPAPPPPAPATAAIYNAAYLNNPKPAYPAISRRLGEEGTVMLRVLVSAEGKPLEVKQLKSSGYERLDNEAIKVVRHWRFVPARKGGQSVESWVQVPIGFEIRS